MKKFAIIAAGGSGQRMGSATPKQFLELNGKTILWHSVKAFADAFNDITIVVVVPAAHIDEAKKLCAGFNDICFVAGGASRFLSVKNGLAAIEKDSIVFIHDAVRCLVTTGLLHRCYEVAAAKGSAIPSIPVNDSLRMIEGSSSKVMDRNSIRIIQTPQTFQSSLILPAFAAEDNVAFTDEATVAEAAGIAIHLVEGEPTNIKITRPADLVMAAAILQQRSSFK